MTDESDTENRPISSQVLLTISLLILLNPRMLLQNPYYFDIGGQKNTQFLMKYSIFLTAALLAGDSLMARSHHNRFPLNILSP